MYSKITIDRSLMYVEQYHIDDFCAIAKEMEKFNGLIENLKTLSEEDAWNVVFNTWVILLPDEFQIIHSVEKSIYYSSNFLILDTLKKDKNFQTLKRRSNGKGEFTFLSALKIAIGIGNWALNVMQKYNLQDILEKNKLWISRESHKKILEMELYLQDQARFTKAIVEEFNTSNSFQEMVRKCCNEAYALYVENF